jgi:hypothetical protein
MSKWTKDLPLLNTTEQVWEWALREEDHLDIEHRRNKTHSTKTKGGEEPAKEIKVGDAVYVLSKTNNNKGKKDKGDKKGDKDQVKREYDYSKPPPRPCFCGELHWRKDCPHKAGNKQSGDSSVHTTSEEEKGDEIFYATRHASSIFLTTDLPTKDEIDTVFTADDKQKLSNMTCVIDARTKPLYVMLDSQAGVAIMCDRSLSVK